MVALIHVLRLCATFCLGTLGTKVSSQAGGGTHLMRLESARGNQVISDDALPLPGKGDLVFDIGASYGPAAKEFHEKWGAKVILLEANYGWVNAYLKPQLGNLTEYVVLHNAISDVDGNSITFYKGCNDYRSSVRKEWLTDPKMRFGKDNCFEKTNVTTRSMDSLIKEYGVPAFIKIDVEGYEENALQGLTQKVPMLAWEVSYPETVPDAERIMAHLAKTGFQGWALRFGDTPFTSTPDAADFKCLSKVQAGELGSILKTGGPKQPEGPMGMLFVTAELPKAAAKNGPC